jgi:hypothetical protein
VQLHAPPQLHRLNWDLTPLPRTSSRHRRPPLGPTF